VIGLVMGDACLSRLYTIIYHAANRPAANRLLNRGKSRRDERGSKDETQEHGSGMPASMGVTTGDDFCLRALAMFQGTIRA